MRSMELNDLVSWCIMFGLNPQKTTARQLEILINRHLQMLRQYPKLRQADEIGLALDRKWLQRRVFVETVCTVFDYNFAGFCVAFGLSFEGLA